MQYDAANRVQSLRRGPVVSPIMTASYTYYNDNRVESVTYSNDTSIVYRYDDGGRLIEIKHLNRIGDVMLKLNYVYDDRDIPTRITESDQTGVVATTDFVYDTRSRLLTERRSGTNGYRLDYTYDLGGNRLTKIGDGKRTDYHYDIEDPCFYGSNNNRLEKYEVFNTIPDPDVLLSTNYYFYTGHGNVERVVTEQEAQPGVYSAIRMAYAHNGQAMTHALSESWTAAGNCSVGEEGTYVVNWAREFRYDGARQRYMNRQLTPEIIYDAQHDDYDWALSSTNAPTLWTDYDGDEAYGDFEIESLSTLTNLRSFQPGMAFNDPWSSSGSTNTKYYHQDMIGTTRDLSGQGGTSTAPSLYSAFGERLAGASPTDVTRYGYAGAWGYQEHDDFPFQHVGARYYDPSAGRFMQRDPIGINGGSNVYAYVSNTPTYSIDPTGLISGLISILRSAGEYVVPSPGPEMAGALACGPDAVRSVMNDAPRRHIARDHPDNPQFDPKCAECVRIKKILNPPPLPKAPPPPPRKWYPIYCFVGETPVLVDTELLTISALRVGMHVQGADASGYSESMGQVIEVIRGASTTLVRIQLEIEVLRCTPEHPFWVVGHGWRPASSLSTGDALLDANGNEVTIKSLQLEQLEIPADVYNVTVDGLHTYFVGNSAILVHNKPK